MTGLFIVIELFGSTFLFLLALVMASGGEYSKATYYMAFSCYLLLLYLTIREGEARK